MVRRITIVLSLVVCAAFLSFAENGLKGAPEGISPKHVDLHSIVHGFGPGGGVAVHAPMGYQTVGGADGDDIKKIDESRDQILGASSNGNNLVQAPNAGTSFNASGQNGWIPYDAAIAVGPTYILVTTNEQFAIYTKTGTLVSLTQNNNFWDGTPSGGFDAKCFYDASAGHFVMEVDKQTNSAAEIDVAVSQTSDPTGAWWIYDFDWTLDGSTKTSNWGDYPSLGYDNSAIYLGANQYSFSGSYKYSKVRVLSKAQLYSGATATYTDFTNLKNADGTSAFTVKAGRMLSSSASEYLINTEPGGGSYVTLWRIDNAPTAPTLTRVATVSVAAYGVPPSARQTGGGSVASGDCRTQDMVMQNGVVYEAFTESYGSHRTSGDGCRVLEVSTTGTKLFDNSYFVSGVDRYYPAVSVDATGNLFMVFSESSPTEYAADYQTGMKTTETGIETASLVKSGTSKITSGRWGDYSGIANDPSNSGAVWEFSGWAGSGGGWATWINSASFGTAPKTINVNPGSELASNNANTEHSFALNANYPNPFNPTTTISYSLPTSGIARLTVFDVLGREIATLADGEQGQGTHQVTFDASNLSSGVYYYKLESAGNVLVHKMLLSK
ncbi:MAG TPA: T9SS type A sorting domain-containing protein [Bacteroidota bacterium]|nr:T9SS type A sorting domain-containing protein [Bacteroidota bacterium]